MTATQSTTLEQVGQRLYFRGSPFAAKDRIKSLGAKWDADQRCWWVGVKKRTEAETLVAELNNGVTAASRDAAVSVGLRTDAPPYMVADKLRDEGKEAEADAVVASTTRQADPDTIRLTGKGRYKGREYYAGVPTADGRRVKLYTLPDDKGVYLEFWADCSEVERTKTYTPREKWDGRRYSGKTVLTYTTLGSIADFIRKQKRAEVAGHPQCYVCGKRSAHLVHDLETGGMACRGCADMPAE